MKIEKINDNQIRCTLDNNDLAMRHIKIDELAYGTKAAKKLFHELMSFANRHFHFDAEDVPLLIEAIPTSGDSITILVTKVNYPEELDTRFANFSDIPSEMDMFSPEDYEDAFPEIPFNRDHISAKDILSLTEHDEAEKKDDSPVSIEPSQFIRLYRMSSLDDVIRLAHVLSGFYTGENTLYHPKDKDYYLLLHPGTHTAVEYNKICNIASEYGTMTRATSPTGRYFAEHTEPILARDALQQLVKMPLTSESC